MRHPGQLARTRCRATVRQRSMGTAIGQRHWAAIAGCGVGPGARTGLRRPLGMDRLCLSALSGLSRPNRCAWRIQRQVHVQPNGSARGLLREPAGPPAGRLPQLLLPARALAIPGSAPGPGPAGTAPMSARSRRLATPRPDAPGVSFFDLHPSPTDLHSEVLAGLSLPRKSLPPKLFYDREGSRLFDAIVTCWPASTGSLGPISTRAPSHTGPSIIRCPRPGAVSAASRCIWRA